MNRIEISSGLMGFFKIEAISPDGTKRLLADWFPNLITDPGLNSLGTNTDFLSNCLVGSGNTTPTVADTSLVAQVATTSNIQSSTSNAQSSSPYYGSITKTYRFVAGTATGNLAEVGIGGSILFSRALILDGGGSPTTITVLSNEVLDVTYQLRLYPNTSDVTGSITISAVSYAFTKRAASVTDSGPWGLGALTGGGQQVVAYSGAIGAITTTPSGSGFGIGVTNAAYGNNNLYRDFTAFFDLNDANLGGIESVVAVFGPSIGRFGSIQMQFTPSLPKDNTKTLTLGFRHSWSRKTLP